MLTIITKKYKDYTQYAVESTSVAAWRITSMLAKPNNLVDLRKHMTKKLQQFYKSGDFLFSLDSLDGEPFLLISSEDSKGFHKDYLAWTHNHKKGLMYVYGKYTYKDTEGYIFTISNGDKLADEIKGAFTLVEYKKLIKDYTSKSLNEVADAMWGAFGSAQTKQPKNIILRDAGINKSYTLRAPPLSAHSITYEWNLVRLLTAKANEAVSKTNPIAGELTTDRNPNGLVTPNGLFIPETATIKLDINGQISKKLDKASVLQETIGKGIKSILRTHLETFKTKMLELDTNLGSVKGDASKLAKQQAKAKTQLDEALAQFEANFVNDGLQRATENWIEHCEGEGYRLRYELSIVSNIAFNGSAIVGGIAAAVASGGILLFLEVAIVIRRTLALVADLYRLARDITTVYDALNRQLAYHAMNYLEDQGPAIWKNVFSEIGDALYITQPVNAISDILGKDGKAKSLKALGADVEEFGGKMYAIYAKAEENTQAALEIIDKADKCQVRFDAVTDRKEKKQLELELNELRQSVTPILDSVGVLGKQYVKYKKTIVPYKTLLEDLTKLQNTSTTAAIVTNLAVPFFKAVKGLRPGDLADLTGKAMELGGLVFYGGSGIKEFFTRDSSAKELAELDKVKQEIEATVKQLKQAQKQRP